MRGSGVAPRGSLSSGVILKVSIPASVGIRRQLLPLGGAGASSFEGQQSSVVLSQHPLHILEHRLEHLRCQNARIRIVAGAVIAIEDPNA